MQQDQLKETLAPGAYGFKIAGTSADGALAVRGAQQWPTISVSQRLEASAACETVLGPRDATIAWGTGRLELDRDLRIATFRGPVTLDDDEVIHPLLTTACAVFARWHGRETLHAGAFVADGRVWGVLGDYEAGKSTLLAQLAMAGYQIVSDDLLVVEATATYAGPRCVDLRASAAARLGGDGAGLGARAGTRHRLGLDAIDGHQELHGFVYLGWDERISLRRVPADQRIFRLAERRSVPGLEPDPLLLLDLAALPAWELRRPRSWELVPAVIERLLATVSSSAA